MPSGSTNFSMNRDDFCKSALRLINVIADGETPSASMIENVSQAMNMMVKNLAGEGIQLFTNKRATVFLQNSLTTYSLGLTGSHATTSYKSTTIRLAAAASATTLEVTTTVGMTAGDYIGVILTDGNVHWTTIASVTDTDTVVITTALVSAAAVGKKVYWYTTKMPRPLRILNSFMRVVNDDYQMSSYTKDMYWDMNRKIWAGRPTAIYYENTDPNGTLYTNYQATDFTETLELVYQRPIEDFDAATDTPDLPQEWYEPLKYKLAVRIAPEYGRSKHARELIPLAVESENNAKNITGYDPRYVSPTRF